MQNVDPNTVEGFGEEWARFDQRAVNDHQLRGVFEQYFSIFPWSQLPAEAVGADIGVGSGRWAKFVAPRVGHLHCVDASDQALAVAKQTLSDAKNCTFHHSSVGALPFKDASLDFCYSLGVLHHVPDTRAAIAACAKALKPGAPLLLYLYYRFDNRPEWFKRLWQVSELGRRTISQLPHSLRHLVTDAIAGTVYLPLSRAARLCESQGIDVRNFPLSSYRNKSFYSMRTDALDRFGTQLEQRFTRVEIEEMMSAAGLERITFGQDFPFWMAVGYRKGSSASK
jgi:SAM-dependent methyltransferase